MGPRAQLGLRLTGTSYVSSDPPDVTEGQKLHGEGEEVQDSDRRS